MSDSLRYASKTARWPAQINTAVCIGVDGLAGEWDVELVASALEGLHKSLEQHGNTLFDAREVFARSSERLVSVHTHPQSKYSPLE